MKKNSQLATALAACVVLGTTLVSFTGVAHACPMCFSGNGINQGAFFWGTIFMMVVPVVTLGTLVYHAWRRIMAIDEHNAAGLEPRKPIVVASAGQERLAPIAVSLSDSRSPL